MHLESKSDGSPVISVLFPIYNGATYLKDAVQSIIDQTFTDFEIIIINDGSTDESESIIEEFNDKRIKYFRQNNHGLSATLNRAIGIASGEYLARQDQDDISYPRRFEKQVEYLRKHPDCGMVGTWAAIWEGRTETNRAHNHPAESLILKFEMLFDNPFVHSSVMIRRKVLETVGMYSNDKSRQPPEDFELWSRVMQKFEIANIPEILLVYREIPNSMSRIGINPFLDKIIKISAENLAWVSGRERTNAGCADLAALVHGAYNKLSPNLNFNEFSRILYTAADNINRFSNTDSTILREKAKARLRSIRTLYLSYQYGRVIRKAITALEFWRKAN